MILFKKFEIGTSEYLKAWISFLVKGPLAYGEDSTRIPGIMCHLLLSLFNIRFHFYHSTSEDTSETFHFSVCFRIKSCVIFLVWNKSNHYKAIIIRHFDLLYVILLYILYYSHIQVVHLVCLILWSFFWLFILEYLIVFPGR